MASSDFKIIGYAHTGITVRSIADSLRFWNGTLGFPILFQATLSGEGVCAVPGAPPNSTVHIAFIALPQSPHAGGVAGKRSELELVQFELSKDVTEAERSQVLHARSWDTGATHMAFHVDGLDAIVEKVKSEGWKLVGSVWTMGDGDPEPIRGERVCYVRGPDGETVELIEFPKKDRQ